MKFYSIYLMKIYLRFYICAYFRKDEDLRMAHCEEESKKYMAECRKKPVHLDVSFLMSNG